MAVATQPHTNEELIASFRVLESLRTAFDSAAAELSGTLGVPTCTACGKCCERSLSPAWRIEGENIISMLLGQPMRMGLILDACEDWLTTRYPGLEDYGPVVGDGVPMEHLYRQMQVATRTRCPLLDGQQCLVHDAEPISCQARGVTWLVPGCERPLGLGETMTTRSYYGGQGAAVLHSAVDQFTASLSGSELGMVGFLPTMLHMRLRAQRFTGLLYDGKIATAKAIFMRRQSGVLFQDDLDGVVATGITSPVRLVLP